jgi:hypothetical protein
MTWDTAIGFLIGSAFTALLIWLYYRNKTFLIGTAQQVKDSSVETIKHQLPEKKSKRQKRLSEKKAVIKIEGPVEKFDAVESVEDNENDLNENLDEEEKK